MVLSTGPGFRRAPLGPSIHDPCHLFQELSGREKVQVTAQGEDTYPAIASSLDRHRTSVIHRARIRSYRVPSGSRGLDDRPAEVVPGYSHRGLPSRTEMSS